MKLILFFLISSSFYWLLFNAYNPFLILWFFSSSSLSTFFSYYCYWYWLISLSLSSYFFFSNKSLCYLILSYLSFLSYSCLAFDSSSSFYSSMFMSSNPVAFWDDYPIEGNADPSYGKLDAGYYYLGSDRFYSSSFLISFSYSSSLCYSCNKANLFS
jgi:hypothetical protein